MLFCTVNIRKLVLCVANSTAVICSSVCCDLQRYVVNMTVSYLMVLSAALILISHETLVTKALHQNPIDCYGRRHRVNGSRSNLTQCFIFQPSETAVMIPSATSSVRKPRYVRKERPSTNSGSHSATIPTAATTTIYDV
ncbi:hypothetical protein DPEC_G00198140 [Dallia pectoralis]|uniref:Uncharacterized protein n=1 Tax=Dallia pectoralis TaxID=75939 RepID=A0ACC2G8D7_DALPE|nr:hypothetical protein DPEC_G00198140 [Dallia pectoralis]